MKTVKTLQAIVTKLAEKHGLDLGESVAHLRIENSPYEPLVIEKIGKNLVSIAHYYTQNGDAIADPDVVLFTGYAEWVPVSIQQPSVILAGCELGGYTVASKLSDDQNSITEFYPRRQVILASFCKTWAKNIREQGWLEHGVKA